MRRGSTRRGTMRQSVGCSWEFRACKGHSVRRAQTRPGACISAGAHRHFGHGRLAHGLMASGERRFDDLWASGWSLWCRRRRRQRHHVRSRRRHIGRTWSESPGGQCTSPWHEGNLIEHGSAFPSQDSGASGLLRMTEATASGSEVGFAFGASNASTVSHVRCLLSGLEPRRLVGLQRMLKCAEKAGRSRSKPFASAPFKLPVCR